MPPPEPDPRAATEAPPERKIGLIPCLAFAVGTMIGGGVFTLSGTAINQAGPAAIVSYLIAGIVMFLSALSFVAVAGRARTGESGYGPIARILGPRWRFLTMWAFYLNGLTIITFLLVSFGDYLNEYFLSGVTPITAGLVAIVLIAALNLGPADTVGKAETYVVGLKVGLLLVFVAWGLGSISDAHFTPFAPRGTSSVFSVAALLFTAYTGFNVVTNMAGSVKDPQRTVPRAVMLSIGISAVVYIGVIVAMLASGVKEFGPAGVGEAATALMGDWGGYLIAFAACLSTLSGANANLLGASELILRLVATEDLPPVAGRTTAKGRPFVSVLFIAAVSVVLVLVGDTNNIVTLANVAALVAMIIVNAAAFQLARTGWPGRGMRLPGGVTIPVLGGVACALQFPSLGLPEIIAGLVLIAAGLLLYRGRGVTKLGGDAVEEAEDSVADVDTPLGSALQGIDLR
ncbi:MAG: APC family permease [Solirubrobacteraceae bacterium]